MRIKRKRRQGSFPLKVHDKFIEILAVQEPHLFKKIDGKFTVVQSQTGEIQPYFYGQDLTDGEFKHIMQFFNQALQEAVK